MFAIGWSSQGLSPALSGFRESAGKEPSLLASGRELFSAPIVVVILSTRLRACGLPQRTREGSLRCRNVRHESDQRIPRAKNEKTHRCGMISHWHARILHSPLLTSMQPTAIQH
jgi:hypothetical protein